MGINQCARSGERIIASTSSSRAYLMGAAVQLDLQELRSIARGEFAGKGAVTGTTGVADVARYAAKAPELRRLRPLRVQNTSLEKEAVGGGASGAVPSQERSLFDPEALQAEADRRNREAAKAGQTDRFCSCGQLATLAIGRCRPSSSNPEGVKRWLCLECFEGWAGGAQNRNSILSTPTTTNGVPAQNRVCPCGELAIVAIGLRRDTWLCQECFAVWKERQMRDTVH